MTNTENNMRFAVLIDADNAPRDSMKSIMEEIAIYGTPTIKRIYGDWTSPNIGGWKSSLLENAVTPIQQFGYTTGKNSTDSAMIIDAMDILYGGKTDGFVLVSSDSDFTRLATRLRETGMYVIGIGERKTPNPFIVACDKFIYIEVIREKTKKVERAAKTAAARQVKKPVKTAESAEKAVAESVEKPAAESAEKTAVKVPEAIVELIADSISDLADDDGFCDLAALGNLLIKKQPDFDPRSFGSGKLSAMLKGLPRFELEVRPGSDPHAKPMYARDKNLL